MSRIKKSLSSFIIKFYIIAELMQYLWENKLWWAIPVIFITVILMLILLFGQSTGLAPFVYPLF